MARLGIPDSTVEDVLALPQNPRATPMLLAGAGRLLAIITALDPVRSQTPATLSRLTRQGIETVLLTGDRKQVAETVAASLGVNRVIGGVKPDGKVREIRKITKDGKRVAMVASTMRRLWLRQMLASPWAAVPTWRRKQRGLYCFVPTLCWSRLRWIWPRPHASRSAAICFGPSPST